MVTVHSVPLSQWAYAYNYIQGDHSPDNVKFPDISPTVRSTRHVNCYSYHARSSVTVSGGGTGVGMQQYMIQNHILNI